MDRPRSDRNVMIPAAARAPWPLGFRLAPGWYYRALIIVLALWVLRSFLEAMLAAGVIAVASWPLYTLFANRMPVRLRRGATPLIFTCLMVVLVLAPMVFAFGALLSEAHTLILETAAADESGIVLPKWLETLPLVGTWIATRWHSDLAQPGTLTLWAQRADPEFLLRWAGSLGQLAAHHALVVGFTILLLFFLYRDGEVLALGCRRVLRERLGGGVERFIDLGTRALRALVNSMLVVGLFDGVATAVAFAIARVPNPALWGAITGALALVPFLGYVAVVALALKLAIDGAASTALTALVLGVSVLLAGDKVLRPMLARGGVSMPFVWILMGCLGGFEALGLVGLVVGPVVLTLVREMWDQRLLETAPSGSDEPVSTAGPASSDDPGTARADP